MTWFRVDDGLADHPKVLGVSLAAMGLWVKAGAWCGKQLTDGKLPRAAVQLLGGTRKLAAELVSAGLWHETQDGYEFHDWLRLNPSRTDVEAERESARERMRALRGNKPRRSQNVRPNTLPNNGECSPEQLPHVRDSRPVPSRPVHAEGEEEPPPPAAETDLEPETRAELDRCTTRSVAADWHRAANQPGGGAPGSVFHAEHAWQRDYETVAAVCNAEQRPRIASRALCLWFWLGPDGPVQTGRVERRKASPKLLAKYVSEDLERAFAWWTSQPREAAE